MSILKSSRIHLEIPKGGDIRYALVNKKRIIPRKDGSILIPSEMLGGKIEIALYSRGATLTMSGIPDPRMKGRK